MTTMNPEITGQTALENYIAKLRADRLSPSTIKKEADYLKICLKYMDKLPMQISPEDIERWRYEMTVERKYERETTFASMLILRKFLRFIGSPAADFKLPARQRRLPPEKEIWLLPDEQQAFISKSLEMGIRDHAMIRLFLDSGIRAGELINVNLTDIDLENKTIHIRHGKGDKSRFVPFTEDTKKAIIEYIQVRKQPNDGSQALFVSGRGLRLSYNQVDQRVKFSGWLKEFAKRGGNLVIQDAGPKDVDEYLYFRLGLDMSSARSTAFDVIFDPELHSGELAEPMARYKELIDEQRLFPEYPIDTASYYLYVDEGFYALYYMSAFYGAAQLKAKMVEKFGPRWYKDPAAGEMLRGLFKRGDALSIDEMLKQIGYAEGLNPDYLAADYKARYEALKKK